MRSLRGYGSQASHILKAAKGYGLDANAYSVEVANLADTPCPYIVYWNFNHFLVVEGFGKDRVYLNYPASGPRSVSTQEFNESYTGIVLYLQPGESFEKGGRKQSVFPGLYHRLKGSFPAFLYCVLLGFLLVLPGLAVPVFSQVSLSITCSCRA